MADNHIKILITRYPQLAYLQDVIQNAADQLIKSYQQGGKLLICGNGGSSADSDHIVGELQKSFELARPLPAEFQNSLKEIDAQRGSYLARNLQQGLPAISLSAHTALTTAVSNDIHGDVIFAQQITGYGTSGDVLIGISTSGNSQNIIDALITAKAKGLTTIGFTGQGGGKMRDLCDVLINVPVKRTAFAQELHFPIYHALCLAVEQHFFEK